MSNEIKETAQLMAAEPARRENSAVVDKLKKDVLTVTRKAREQIGTLTVSLEQAPKEVDVLKKKNAAIHGLEELREGKEHA